MLTIRERAPLRLSVQITSPNGTPARWGLDEPAPANVPAGISFSSTMPGGFDQFSCTLPRKPGLDYPDQAEFSTVTVRGAGGEVAWQGRLETAPRTSGDQVSVTPGAVGWQAALDDDQSARMIYVDTDLSKWQAASTPRKLAIQVSPADETDASVAPGPNTVSPALVTQITGPWTRSQFAEGWYDAKGLQIGSVYYAWQQQGNGSIGDQVGFAGWQWYIYLSSDDIATTVNNTSNLAAAGPGTGTLTSTGSRTFAMAQVAFSGAGGNDGVNYPIYWTCLAVYGTHGLTPRGTATATTAQGFYASDIVQHAVSTWASRLATTRGGVSTIEATSFVIPQIAFPDPTTATAIIAQALSYELLDWWVDEGPTFNLASRENHGRDWRARVGPSGLQETGPQVERMYNAIIVSYNDVTGAARTVGPPGSTANTTDSSLQDTDATNPVNAAGLYRPYEMPNIGVSTAAGAVRVGQVQLAAFKAASTAGQAQITGHAQDAAGVWWPAWMIRAGDRIVFTDAHDTTARRITKTSYDDASKVCQVTLDSPPEGIAATLARMSIVLAPLGF